MAREKYPKSLKAADYVRIYKAGANAARSGKGRNPYTAGTAKHAAWNEGYKSAKK